jgi:hypothetical protein
MLLDRIHFLYFQVYSWRNISSLLIYLTLLEKILCGPPSDMQGLPGRVHIKAIIHFSQRNQELIILSMDQMKILASYSMTSAKHSILQPRVTICPFNPSTSSQSCPGPPTM